MRTNLLILFFLTDVNELPSPRADVLVPAFGLSVKSRFIELIVRIIAC